MTVGVRCTNSTAKPQPWSARSKRPVAATSCSGFAYGGMPDTRDVYSVEEPLLRRSLPSGKSSETLPPAL